MNRESEVKYLEAELALDLKRLKRCVDAILESHGVTCAYQDHEILDVVAWLKAKGWLQGYAAG